MKFILAFILLIPLISQASYQKEVVVWNYGIDWATYDKELKVFYRFLPMTEKAHDVLVNLDRRQNYECYMKERNLRDFFKQGSLVVAVYDVKNCVDIGPNENWAKK